MYSLVQAVKQDSGLIDLESDDLLTTAPALSPTGLADPS